MSDDLTLHYCQDRLFLDFDKAAHAIVAGIGYGKTMFGPKWLEHRRVRNPKSKEFLVVAPTYKLLKQRCFEDYRAFLSQIGLREGRRGHYRYNRSDQIIEHRSGQRVIGLTGERPEGIVSYNSAAAWIDEAALQPEQVHKNVIKRNRCPFALTKRQRLYTSTPEGLNWFYETFGPSQCERMNDLPMSVGKNKLVLHGSSFDNPYLDEEFFDVLREEFAWDEAYFQNYILGEWVSLGKDRFYFAFTEAKNVGDYPLDPENRRMVLTWDNNVGKMTWVLAQKQGRDWYARADNGSSGRNIEDCCDQFLRKFEPAHFGNWHLEIYGDAALHARSVHSWETGYEIIENLLKPHYRNLVIKAHRANPFVEERSRCTNGLLAKSRLYFNRSCRTLIHSAKAAESDGRGGIKKPKDDKVTHAMEALDMAMICLEPLQIRRERTAFNLT